MRWGTGLSCIMISWFICEIVNNSTMPGMEFMWWRDHKKTSFWLTLQRWTHPPLFIDKLKESFWVWTQPLRGSLLWNTVSHWLGPYPEWSSQSSGNTDSFNERQHYLKPSLNLAGPYPEWSLQSIDSCCHSVIYCTWLRGCSWNPAFCSRASTSGPKSWPAIRSTALHQLLLSVQ